MAKRRSENTISRVITAALAAVRGTRGKRSKATARPQPGAWNVQLLRELDWQRFEDLCSAYFEDIGYEVRAARSGDGEKLQLALFPEKRAKPALLVHCAARTAGPADVMQARELLSAMADAGVSEGFLIARAGFSEDAHDFAAVQRIRLLDAESFVRYLNALLPEQSAELYEYATEGDYRTPTCPLCGKKMAAQRGANGQTVWRCPDFPVCDKTLSAPG